MLVNPILEIYWEFIFVGYSYALFQLLLLSVRDESAVLVSPTLLQVSVYEDTQSVT